MSQDYHQGVFSFFNGFERSSLSQQDKHRVQGIEPCMEDEESGGIPEAYETGGMLSEIFKYFPPRETTTATELPENRITGSFRDRRPLLAGVAATGDWFLNRQEDNPLVGGGLVNPLVDSKNQISSINADPEAVMQFFSDESTTTKVTFIVSSYCFYFFLHSPHATSGHIFKSPHNPWVSRHGRRRGFWSNHMGTR